MALKGTLKDFSLADILQLIGIQRKTGVLNLHGDDDHISISFVQGSIVSAESVNQRLEERVATVLLKWGHCTPDQLQAARQTQQQTLERLWTVLLGQQSVSADEIRQALLLQIEKIIYPVFRWTDGEYSFIQEADIDFDSQHLIPIHSETVLMEGVRMMDEWPLLERKIRSSDMVFSRASMGGKVVVNDDNGEADQDGGQIRISGEEYAIYDLVDGVRSVAEIQEVAPVHDFSTANVLNNLLGLGLITQSGDSRVSAERIEDSPSRVKQTRRFAVSAVLGLVMILILAAIVPRLHLNPVNGLVRGLLDSDRAARLGMLCETSRVHRVVEQLEAYRLEHGVYPEHLLKLAQSGFVAQEEITSMSGEPYAYIRTGERFSLAAHSGSLAASGGEAITGEQEPGE